MSWFMAATYNFTCGPAEKAGLSDCRAQLLSGLEGEVLEVGVGTGFNLPHYTTAVTRLVLSEPDVHMRQKFERKHGEHLDAKIELVEASLNGRLPMDDASFDGVVSTLVLCSVAEPPHALAEIWRVLRPGGMFAFLEHVAEDQQMNPSKYKWQGRVEPLWKRLMDNCHLRRDTGHYIEQAGFAIEWTESGKMPKAPPWIGPCMRGVAHKPA